MHFGEVSNTTTTKSAHRFIHSKRNSSCSPEHKAWSILMTISVELFVTNFAESSCIVAHGGTNQTIPTIF